MSDSASNTEDSIQIEIFPSRILSPETAQKLMREFVPAGERSLVIPAK